MSNASNNSKSQTTVVLNSKFNDNKRNKGSNQGLQCKHCGIKGHTIEKCYNLVGYAKDFKPRNGGNKYSNNHNNNNFSIKNSYERSFSGNNVVSLNTDTCSFSVNISDFRSLTQEQFNKLLQLISEKQSMDETTVGANMTGTSCNFFYKFSYIC